MREFNFKTNFFHCLLIVVGIFSVNASAKPKCDTAHLEICARELIQGSIDSGELVAHWEGGNYITGNLVIDSTTRRFFYTVKNYKGYQWPDYKVASSISSVVNYIRRDAGTQYYYAGSWHHINAPVFEPKQRGTSSTNKTMAQPILLTATKIGAGTPTKNVASAIGQTVVNPSSSQQVATGSYTTPSKQTTANKPSRTQLSAQIALPTATKIGAGTPTKRPNKIVQKIPTPTVISNKIGTGTKHSKITLSNTHKPVTTINYNNKHKAIVSNKQIYKAPNIQHTVSLQVSKLHYKNAKKVNATNVNKHLISTVPGNNVEQNHHAILIDHDDRVWRCKVSGLGHRNMKSQSKEEVSLGHAETMHFRNSTFNHISNNISINNNCLISVSK